MKRAIKINETDLRRMISESVKRTLNEISQRTAQSAYDKADDAADISLMKDSIYNLRNGLWGYAKSFSPLHGQEGLSYFFANKRPANDGQARKLLEYLDEIEKFFDRKAAQQENLSDFNQTKRNDAEKEIVQIARSKGLQGNSVEDIINPMSDEEFEQFMNELPEELSNYLEDHF